MSPTQNSIVLLTILSGTEKLQQSAIVLSSSPGAEGQQPLLNLAFLHPRRLDLLGGPDWRNAFDRRITVKHESHDDVKNSAEGCYWNELPESEEAAFASFEINRLTTFLLDNFGRECNADTAVGTAITILGRTPRKATPEEEAQLNSRATGDTPPQADPQSEANGLGVIGGNDGPQTIDNPSGGQQSGNAQEGTQADKASEMPQTGDASASATSAT